ncbi:SAM-dependent methyltransferase [Nocardioides yefusunii]|uniref:Class I SAM-dependent methyltransferase n=1 Tax=Nocardioides yefusunii TaxID=2500546 RepID=A0ABW1QYG9_9ACTN|nr:cyclopropane-fatty-acyl-phospholipid synthase family protein [Nocardioides yefusunii]
MSAFFRTADPHGSSGGGSGGGARDEGGTSDVAGTLASLFRDGMPVRLTAWDGSSAGPADSLLGLHLRSERALSYLVTAPGDLGMARAWASGDLEISGAHPGDPYDLLLLLLDRIALRVPGPGELVRLVRTLGPRTFVPPTPPPQEHLPRWRRLVEGMRHSEARDAEAIEHHYDVSNAFYSHVLGESMAYTCALYTDADRTLEQAQYDKFDLVARKLELAPGQRLLDVGCGWGGMAMHAAREYGVHVTAVTLSPSQAEWGQRAVREAGLEGLVEIRHQDYREVTEGDFDAISSIGLMEHVGVKNYGSYFTFLRGKLKPQGRLLNHCITRPHNHPEEAGAFIDRYVFPDGELTGSGRIVTEAQDAGLEVVHTENLRKHYAMTLRDWNANLVEHWDECVAEAGAGTARIWGLYLAASRLGFERDKIQLHQVLAVRTEDGDDGLGLRPHW